MSDAMPTSPRSNARCMFGHKAMPLLMVSSNESAQGAMWQASIRLAGRSLLTCNPVIAQR